MPVNYCPRIVNSAAYQTRGFILPLVVGAILLIAVIFGALWLFVNAHDEALIPQVRLVLDAKHDSISPEANLYFAILAFDSQNDADINQQGQELYASYLRARQANAGVTFNFDKAAAFARQPFIGNKDALCGRPGQAEDCVERAIVHRKELEMLVSDNRLLLDRYKSVSAYAHLQNPIYMTPNAPVASWMSFMAAKRLFLMDVALEMSYGRIDAGIAHLRSDFAFTRHILAEPDILLIDKMILAASARDSLTFISDLLRSRTLSDAQYAELQAMVAPFSEDERSLAGVFSREFAVFDRVIRDVTDPRNASRVLSGDANKQSADAWQAQLGSHFIKYNASLNFAWSFVEEKPRASRAICENFLANKAQMERRFGLVGTDYIYNPIGKILVKIAAPGGVEYIQSMCDLDGMNRIVALQIMIRSQHMRDEDIENFLQHAGAQYRNPFTGQPMQVEAGKPSVTFQPVASRDASYFPWPI
jgi:hypothetical protein